MKSIDKLLAISAIIVSVSALFVSVKQTEVFSAQKDAQVWPYVRIAKGWGPDYLVLSVANKGIGPAIIKKVTYEIADTTFQWINDYASYVKREYGDSTMQNLPFTYTNIEAEGTALMAGETVEILSIKHVPNILKMIREMPEMHVTIEYCSVYNKCWVNRDNVMTEK